MLSTLKFCPYSSGMKTRFSIFPLPSNLMTLPRHGTSGTHYFVGLKRVFVLTLPTLTWPQVPTFLWCMLGARGWLNMCSTGPFASKLLEIQHKDETGLVVVALSDVSRGGGEFPKRRGKKEGHDRASIVAECGNGLCEVGERCLDEACVSGCRSDCPAIFHSCPVNEEGEVCSSRGACMPSIGVCQCFEGYEGATCDRCKLGNSQIFECVFASAPMVVGHCFQAMSDKPRILHVAFESRDNLACMCNPAARSSSQLFNYSLSLCCDCSNKQYDEGEDGIDCGGPCKPCTERIRPVSSQALQSTSSNINDIIMAVRSFTLPESVSVFLLLTVVCAGRYLLLVYEYHDRNSDYPISTYQKEKADAERQCCTLGGYGTCFVFE